MMAISRTKMVPLLLLLPLLIAAGCGDDPTGINDDQAPALPDQESLTLQVLESNSQVSTTGSSGTRWPREVVVEDYGRAGGSSDKNAPELVFSADSASNSNFLAGRVVAEAAAVAIAAFSAAPAAAFAGASLATPVKQEDGSWNWTYSVIYNGVAHYDLTLNGKNAGASTDWAMRVTSSGVANSVTDFLWYSGSTSNGGATGSWQLYDMGVPQTTTNLVRVDWNRVSADNRSAVWLNNRVGSTHNGDELTFEQNEDEISMTYQGAGAGTSSFVRWNVDSTEGSVRVPIYNGGVEACWDSQHLNTNCAQ